MFRVLIERNWLDILRDVAIIGVAGTILIPSIYRNGQILVGWLIGCC